MKTLFLLRHAKSSWDEPGLTDFDRPLNERGRRTAPFMGELMAAKGFLPSVILSSPAVRAKQTAILVKDAGHLDAVIRFEPRIYEATPNDLHEVVSGIDDTYASAMLVGHNPGMEGFLRFLTGQLEPMPTAALALIELETNSWSAIHDASGELKTIFRPKEVMG